MTCGLFFIFWPKIALIMRMLQGSINQSPRESPRKTARGFAARLLWAGCKHSVRIYPECPSPRSGLEVDHSCLVYPTSGNGAELAFGPTLLCTIIYTTLGHIGQRGQYCVTYWCGAKEQADMGPFCSGLHTVCKIVVK